MRGIIFYRRGTESDSKASNFKRDFEHFTSKKIELLDVDTREGATLAKLYDMVSYPAVIALDDDGKLRSAWQGDNMPRIDDVSGYL